MQRCWMVDPAARPTFGALAKEIERVASVLRGDHYVQLPATYVNLSFSASAEEEVPPEQSPSPPVCRIIEQPHPLSEPPQSPSGSEPLKPCLGRSGSELDSKLLLGDSRERIEGKSS